MVELAAGSWAQGLIYFFVFLPYLLVSTLVYRRLIPRLLPLARLAVYLFLGAQATAIFMSQVTLTDTGVTGWLWDLDKEWNIPSTLASTQLAQVGATSLLIAWLVANRSAWQRLYFFGIGLVFLFFAYDEYAALHEVGGYQWIRQYAAIGFVVILATLAVAYRSPKRSWVWYACLPIGLAVSAFGAASFEWYLECGAWGVTKLFGDCVYIVVLEEALEFLGIWLALVAILGQFSEISSSLVSRFIFVLFLFPALWVMFLLSREAIKPISQQTYAEGAAVAFEGGARLHAYEIDRNERDSLLHIHLYLSSRGWDFAGLGYSINLTDQVTYAPITRRDSYGDHRLDFKMAPDYRAVYRQWAEVEIPREMPANRAYWIVLTLWHEEDGQFFRHKVLSSDLQLMSDSQVVLGEFVLPAPAAPLAQKLLATFENGFALQATELHERVAAGETLGLQMGWRSDVRGQEDYIQFLHFGHEDSGEWFVYDQEPLGARLPTRLWYNGLSDSEVWQVPLPPDLASGSYAVFSGLYHSQTKERVIVRDSDGMPFPDSRVPLGKVTVEGAG